MARHEIQSWKEIKIGVFSLIAIALFVFAIIMVGGGGKFWEKKAILHAQFSGIEGVKIGAPVTIGGVVAGRVKNIIFVKSNESYLAELNLEVREKNLPMIRKDSIVQIKTQGMMGDRYLEITMGQLNSPPINPGDYIQSLNQSSFEKLTTQTSNFIVNLSGLSDELEILIHNINDGTGSLGKLARDPVLYDRTTGLLTEIENLVEAIKEKPKKYFKFSVF